MKSNICLVLFSILILSGCVKKQSIQTESPIRYSEELELQVITLELEYMIEDVKFSELMFSYNLHLFDEEFHPEEVEKEFFEAFCIEDEHDSEIPSDASPPERLEIIGWWMYGLDECCQEFGAQFGNHLDYFHSDLPLGIEHYEIAPVPDSLPFQDKLLLIEENMKLLGLNVKSLNEVYQVHIEDYH